MKAAQFSEYGDATVVSVVDIDKPVPQAGQVLVEVHAASLNPFDSAVRAGYMQQNIPLQLPVTLGGDIAGVIVDAGTDTGFAVGDMVYGQANVVAKNSGAFAEYAATAAGQIAKAPSNISLQEAASLALVGVSAWQALTQHIQLQSGQKLFITGGAGGIGRVAIQIAKHLGAYVATTASGEGLETAKSLGADEVIDYKSQNYVDLLRDYDAVFDTVGGEGLNTTLHVLKPGATAVTMAGQYDAAATAQQNITAMSQMTHVTTAALDALRELVETSVVTPAVGKVFALDDVQAAFTARESGAVAGKVVLAIKNENAK